MPVESAEAGSVNMRRLDIMSDSESSPGGGGFAAEDDKQRMMATYARLTTVSEWRQLAVVLDRLLLVCFLVVACLVFFAMGTN